MSYKKLTVKRSKIEGYGLYANELIRKGEIIMFWMANAYLIKELDYNTKQSMGDQQMIATGARYVGDMFLYTDIGYKKDRYENYINHSFNPNVLYHCGVCFALKDIQPDEELTTDYTYLLSENDQETFLDEASNREVRGISWQKCLLHTTEQLQKLLTSCALEKLNVEKNKLELYTNDVEQLVESPKSVSSTESISSTESVSQNSVDSLGSNSSIGQPNPVNY